jgi:hypothetical protein
MSAFLFPNLTFEGAFNMTAIISIRNFSNSVVAKTQLDEAYGTRWIYVDKYDHRRELGQSPLANPHFVDRKNPKLSLERYRRYLWDKIRKGDYETLQLLRSLKKNDVLVCQFLAPSITDSYPQVIIKAAQYVQTNNL